MACNALLLYGYDTDDGVCDDFLCKISDHFPKISEDFRLKLFRRPRELSRTFPEHFRRLPKSFSPMVHTKTPKNNADESDSK